MDAAFLASISEALEFFEVEEQKGLDDRQVKQATEKYGRNGTVH